MSSLPGLARAADAYVISERVNVLIREFNAQSTATTVGNLPSAAAMGAGARAFVSDANSTTFGAVVAAGGSNAVPVYSDGTDWRIG